MAARRYANRGQGAVVWFIGEDKTRYRFTEELPITFYVGGDPADLDSLCSYLTKIGVQFAP